MGVARRWVSLHVSVRAKSERSDRSRLELKTRSESLGRRKNGLIPDGIILEQYDWEKTPSTCYVLVDANQCVLRIGGRGKRRVTWSTPTDGTNITALFCNWCFRIKQGVALTGRNTTGPPLAAPDELRCICECYRRRQTTTTDASDRY